MGNCRIHPNVNDDLIFGCAACNAEKAAQNASSGEGERRHTESMEAQEEAARIAQQQHEEEIEETRRFHEQQQATAKEQAYHARRQAEAAEEAREDQRRHLAEERARRTVEEEREELRTGLREFDEDFRAKWYSLCHAKEDLERSQTELDADLVKMDAEIASAEEGRTSLFRRISNESEADYDRMLTKHRDTDVPFPRTKCDHDVESLAEVLDNDKTLFTLYNATFGCPEVQKGYVSIRPSFKPLKHISSEAALLLSLKDTFDLLNNFPVARTSQVRLFLGILSATCAGFLTLFAVLVYLQAASQSASAPVSAHMVVITEAMVCPLLFWMVALFLLCGPYLQRRSQTRRLAGARESALQFLKRALQVPLATRGIDSHDPRTVIDKLGSCMQKDYIDEAALRPDRVDLLIETANAVNTALEKELERLTRFNDQNPMCDIIRDRYDYMCREIRRVGSEIIRGLRVPDRKISALDCPNCAGPVTSESRQCPYCGVSLSI